MTISTTANKVSYAGDGTTLSFAIPFLFLENAHIGVVLRDVAGLETAWALNTQFTLTGAGLATGGTLDVAVNPTDYTPANGETLVIRRVVPETQETDYPEGGAFPASAHEQALDKLTMLVQQHSEEIARAPSLPVSSSLSDILVPEPGAAELIRWNAAGSALETVPAADLNLDAVIAAPTLGDKLTYNGSVWANRADGAVNVLDYGAIGDGATDDTAALNAALAAAAGGSIFIPRTSADYKISATLTLPSHIAIVSDGATIKAAAGSYAMMLASSQTDISVEGLVFDGDYPTRAANSGSTLEGINVARFRVRDCRFLNSPNTSISISRGQYVWIQNNTMSVQYHSGVRLNDPGVAAYNQYIWIENNHITGSNAALQGGHGAVCCAATTGLHGNRYVWITGNYAESNSIGFALDSFSFSLCQGNTVKKASSEGECIALSGDNYRIIGNECSGSIAAGILLFGTTTYPNENLLVQGNTCFDNAQGIAMVFGESNVNFKNVTITDNTGYNTASGTTQSYGFQVYKSGASTSLSTENCIVANNNFAENATGGISIITDAGIREGVMVIDNESGNDGLESSGYPFKSRLTLKAVVGATDVESTEEGVEVFHRAATGSTSGSVVRIGAYYNANGTRRGGVQVRKAVSFANAVITDIIAYGGGSDQTVLSAAIGSSTGRYVHIPGGAYNDGRLVFGAQEIWLDAGGQFRHHTAAPIADTDGKRLVSVDFEGSVTWNPASLADGAGETSANIAVTGVTLGDHVLVSAPFDTQGILITGWVSASNTVKIRIQNETGGTIDLASGTWKLKIIRQ
jgi:hypothetical protein